MALIDYVPSQVLSEIVTSPPGCSQGLSLPACHSARLETEQESGITIIKIRSLSGPCDGGWDISKFHLEYFHQYVLNEKQVDVGKRRKVIDIGWRMTFSLVN